MREKYIDQKIGVWFVFGERPDGAVDVSNGTDDVLTGIPRAVAEQAIAAHDTFRQELYRILKDV